MCGIAGYWDKDGADAAIVKRMATRIRHRGPDDAGIHLEEGIGLGSRRLAILDLSSRGHMPMHNDDRSLVITYNGEVYNYRDLRTELEANGIAFRSDSGVS